MAARWPDLAFDSDADPLTIASVQVQSVWQLVDRLPPGFQGLQAGITRTEVQSRTYADYVRHGLARFGEPAGATQSVTLTWKFGAPGAAVVNSIATGGSLGTLSDSGQSWRTNQWRQLGLVINAGTAAGNVRTILSNTATVLTVDYNFGVAPDATSAYTIWQTAGGYTVGSMLGPPYLTVGIENSVYWVKIGVSVVIPSGLADYLKLSSLVSVA